MAKKRTKAADAAKPIRFDQKLVLNQWMLSLFEVGSFEQLADKLKFSELEGLDEDNVHRFMRQLKLLWQFEAFPGETLQSYDENIVKHSLELNRHRAEPIHWKYFQWLSLLFTEIYLDRFFQDSEQLLRDLNSHVVRFNRDKPERDRVAEFVNEDLRKLAFWNATGSGKTLLMHVNILQYRFYLEKHGRTRELNRIILLTPNEGLSRQHLREFEIAGMQAEMFSKDGRSLFSGKSIEIIEVTKLREQTGEKTVAIDAFEGNNLVLVDEGHRGSSGKELGQWMDARRRLCEKGFSFEYSATFGQAMKASGNKELEHEYAKCILFDYSYKYFYKDGFGKDYRILNLANDSDDDQRGLYLTACLLAFHQQQKLFHQKTNDFKPYLLENPLWVFVGGKVNAVRTENKLKVSDVIDILLFLAEFVKERKRSVNLLERLLSGKPGLHDVKGNEIFGNSFGFLSSCGLDGEQAFGSILKLLFNSDTCGKLHVENLKGTDGEIALRIGDNEPFGLINVGDTSTLCDLCEEFSELLVVGEKEFSGTLFGRLNESNSTVNILIGSKKFTEGWNSWRVSTMGLMNVGKSEGSEIIQLFGRGVRLKGLNLCLKRSSQVDTLPSTAKPRDIGLLETLNIFGIRAQYMQQFKEYLEDEGLPANEDRIEIILPVVKNLDGKKLTSVRLKDGVDYKRQGTNPELDNPPEHLLRYPLVLNWYPKIQTRQSRELLKVSEEAVAETGKLSAKHLAFMDFDAIYFDLLRFKNERTWHNLSISRESIIALLKRSDWYKLLIPAAELEFGSFSRVKRWEDIASALLKKYVDRFYKHRKQEWESEHLEYHELSEDDPNFLDQYTLLVDQSAAAIVTNLELLKEMLEAKTFSKDWNFKDLSAIWFGRNLYQPLLHFRSEFVEVAPVSLNPGERDFVLDLRRFFDEMPDYFKHRELYLLRNMSRGKGIGFFEAGNFYPDFIVWMITADKQFVTFVDPKGLRNIEGPDDPKIRFHRTIKEIESRLGDSNVVLNSFVIANTPFQQVRWWTEDMSKEQFKNSHVLFQADDRATYIKQLLMMATSDVQVMADTL